MSEESTTPDLVEILPRYVEAGNRRDFDAVDSFYTRGVAYVTQAGTFEGAGAIRGFSGRPHDRGSCSRRTPRSGTVAGAVAYETEEILADGEDFVVARVRIVGHGAHSGAPIELRWVASTGFATAR
jgi:ketosteroid isomerase-like protein